MITTTPVSGEPGQAPTGSGSAVSGRWPIGGVFRGISAAGAPKQEYRDRGDEQNDESCP